MKSTLNKLKYKSKLKHILVIYVFMEMPLNGLSIICIQKISFAKEITVLI